MSLELILCISLTASILGILFLFFFSWWILLGYYYYRFALKRRKNKIDNIITNSIPGLSDTFRFEKEWLENLKLEDIYITSFDNLKLHGYFSRQDSHTYILFSHGYRGIYKEATAQLKAMQEIFKPVNILMIDQRAHNLSEGKHLTMGYREGNDLTKWIDKILEMDKDAKIILYGQSMGASTIFFAEGYNLPSNVKCAICDSGYTTIYDEFRYEIDIKMDDSRLSLSRSTLPTLFIHGTNDRVVPYFFQEQNIRAFNKNTPYERMDIEGAEHCMGFYKDERKYMDKVEKFVKKYL